MSVKDRLKKLEGLQGEVDYKINLFVLKPGTEGRDAEGFTPDDRTKYDATKVDNYHNVNILNIIGEVVLT